MVIVRISWFTPALLFAISSALLLTAFMFEHIGGLEPCELCWYQRYAHMTVIALLLPALYFHRNSSVLVPFLVASALALLVGTGFAGFQVGVERGLWESACATPIQGESLDDIRASLMAAPIVPCDEVAWSLWKISMAGWNGLASLAMSAGAMYAAFTAGSIK